MSNLNFIGVSKAFKTTQNINEIPPTLHKQFPGHFHGATYFRGSICQMTSCTSSCHSSFYGSCNQKAKSSPCCSCYCCPTAKEPPRITTTTFTVAITTSACIQIMPIWITTIQWGVMTTWVTSIMRCVYFDKKLKNQCECKTC